ncbi:MAG TPA: BTAD domain-containing putative transcriptional regulator [Longimicrobiales bacterium]|nr:BTAD domain-containing putative transcriptional regulator [Longimicrobiales bacterium]
MRHHFRLITLGRLALVSDDGGNDSGLNRQRRKLAVLAVLALERRPVPRDVLLEMFWGDQVESRARHSLSDALSHLRRVLGRDAITARRSDVSLSAGAPLRVDAVELAEAVGAGADERAISLSGGRFLDAIYVGGSPRFEQWVQRESVRLDRLFHTACERRCSALLRLGEWQECEQIARRWLSSDPLSTAAALSLLTAVRGDGARELLARALDEYEALCRVLAAEYELRPGREVTERAAALQSELAESGAVDMVAGRGPQPQAVRSDVLAAAAVPADPDAMAVPASSDLPAPQETVTHPRRRMRRRVGLFALAAAALVAVIVPLLRRTPPASPATVAIFPFTLHGSAEYGYLREGLVDLLSTNLDGAAGLRTVDPRAVLSAAAGATDRSPGQRREVAAQLGAARYVMGDIAEAGGRLRITAAIYDVARGDAPARRAYAEGDADSLFAVVDRLTVALLEERVQRIGGRVARIAALTTSSIPALKAYLTGEQHWRAMRLGDAVDAFREATRHDSTFALAWYRLGMASSWDANVDVAVDAMERATRHSGMLSERDRMLIAAYPAHRDPDRAERLYRAVVADYPADVEAWAGLAEMLFHANPWNGRSFRASRQAWEHVLRLEPHNVSATWHLAYVSAREGRHAELDSLTRRIQASVGGDADLSIRAIRAVTLGSDEDRTRVLADLALADDFSLILAVWRVAVSTEDLEAALRFADLLVGSLRPREVRALGHGLRAHLHFARGRLASADAELGELARIDPVQALEYRALFAAHPLHAAGRRETADLLAQLHAWQAAPAAAVPGPADLWVNVHADVHPDLRIYLIGLLSARLGDVGEAERSASLLAGGDGDSDAARLTRSLAVEIRAELMRASGRPGDALALLETSREMIDYGSARTSPFYARSRLRFLHAELLRETGRDADALGWYAGFAEIYPHDVVHLAPAYLRRAGIMEQRGDANSAAACYRRFLALLEGSDPALRPLTMQAENALNRLPVDDSTARCPAEPSSIDRPFG